MKWLVDKCSWRRFSMFRAILWTVLLFAAMPLGWLKSVSFVSILSIIALIESAVAAWRADVPNKEEE